MQDVKKLLTQYKPNNYKIHIKLNRELDHFDGTARVAGTAQEETNEIQFHAKDITIDSVSATIDGNAVDALISNYNKDEQTITVQLSQSIKQQQEVDFDFSFHADIVDSMHGIYPAKYTDNGEAKTIISTQFESHHAREAFPCIDEPAAKATFDLEITAPKEYEIVSNAPQTERNVEKDFQTVGFDSTPVMSTYLLAFAIGDFASIEDKTDRGTLVRAFAPHEHVEHLKFALNTAVKCLEFYENYFGINYPLDKCDLLAIPEFAAGAMENWGCITFREVALLVDEENSSLSNKQWVALVVAHELAHQWFGNLVTMKWWDDLWLNEGFASWIEFLVIDEIYPEWDMWTNFVVEDYAGALQLDALESSHPIRIPVHDPREINEIFDSITYRKGASIIRMLNNYLGDDVFQKGLTSYLKSKAYSNATTEDLWAALSEASGVDVEAFMEAWTKKTGYPYIQAQKESSSWKLRQNRFFVHPDKNDDDTIWHVPLLPDNESGDKLLLKEKRLEINDDSIIHFNKHRSGVYRTGYNEKHYEVLATKVAEQELDARDRIGLLDDSFALARSNKIPTTSGLKLLTGYSAERVFPVWEAIASELISVRSTILTKEHEIYLKPLVIRLIKNLYEELGWEPDSSESDNDKLTRPIIISLALRYDCFDARDIAHEKMNAFLENDEPILAELRTPVYTSMARTGDQALFEAFKQKYLESNLQEEKQRLASALASFTDEKIIPQSINMIRSDDVRQQDVISWIARLMRNEYSREQTWKWYQDNWDWLHDSFKDGHIYSYLAQILKMFSSKEKYVEVEKFFKSKDTNGLDMSLRQALETIDYKAQWRERDQESVIEFLKNLG